MHDIGSYLLTEAVLLDYEAISHMEHELCRRAFPFRLLMDYFISRYLGEHSNQTKHWVAMGGSWRF